MIDGRWLVNGKRYEDMSEEEKEILCKFFIKIPENLVNYPLYF